MIDQLNKKLEGRGGGNWSRILFFPLIISKGVRGNGPGQGPIKIMQNEKTMP